MKIKAMLPVFSSVFMAELGDKTQLATLMFMAGGAGAALGGLEVFLAAGTALVLSTFLAVVFGAAVGRIVSPRALKAVAGLAFLGLGGVYIFQGLGG